MANTFTKQSLSHSDISRFNAKFTAGSQNECWPWKGTVASNGYGLFSFSGRANGNVGAHRISWLLAQDSAHASIGRGTDICHKCDNRICVNPNHLFQGTHRDNMFDAFYKGILKPFQPMHGEQNPRATLTAHSVKEIRALASAGMKQRDIASKFGVRQAAVWNVIHKRTWAHVE